MSLRLGDAHTAADLGGRRVIGMTFYAAAELGDLRAATGVAEVTVWRSVVPATPCWLPILDVPPSSRDA
jgi:hypothetical protein